MLHRNDAQALVESVVRCDLTAIRYEQVKRFNTPEFEQHMGYAAAFFRLLQDSIAKLETEEAVRAM